MMEKNKNGYGKTALRVGALIFLIGGFVAILALNQLLAGGAHAKSTLSTTPGSFSELVKRASPSVLNISVVKKVKGRGLGHGWVGWGCNKNLKELMGHNTKSPVAHYLYTREESKSCSNSLFLLFFWPSSTLALLRA